MKPLVFIVALVVGSALFAADQESTASYPLETCIVSGEMLGGMGKPYVLNYQTKGQPDREVRLCCEMCVGRFNSNPARFLAKLDAAKASQKNETSAGEACCAEGACAPRAEKPATNDNS